LRPVDLINSHLKKREEFVSTGTAFSFNSMISV
jgi:hypothetical protein